MDALKLFLTFIGSIFTTLWNGLVFIWNILKFIISKSWKFILAILTAMLGIFITKKAVEKE